MLIAFELLQEAGLRLPDPIGDTVSIIGALIVGQSAVEARLVSAPMLIIVAFSGVTALMVPVAPAARPARGQRKKGKWI